MEDKNTHGRKELKRQHKDGVELCAKNQADFADATQNIF